MLRGTKGRQRLPRGATLDGFEKNSKFPWFIEMHIVNALVSMTKCTYAGSFPLGCTIPW